MSKKIIIILGLAALIVIAIITKGFGFFNANAAGASKTTLLDPSLTEPEEVKELLSEISEQARWYEYEIGGTKIRFFAVKAADGSIKTGFDACDVCYKAKKGYRQDGGIVVCNNCGKRYPISSIGTENKNPGGCWPGYLPSSIEGEYVVIKKSDLESGKWRFA